MVIVMIRKMEAERAKNGSPLLDLDSHELCKTELARYNRIESTPAGQNPLDFWKDHAALFPNLAELARSYLAVQASSAASERIFSQAKRLISCRRNRLNPQTAGKTFFVSLNWEWMEERVSMKDMFDNM